MSEKKKRKDLNLSEKVLVLKELENKNTQAAIAKKFGISQAQVCSIAKKKDIILQNHKHGENLFRKRKRKASHEDIDEALFRWFKQARSRNAPINGPILKEKACNLAKELEINDFQISDSWIQRWRERRGIVLKNSMEKSRITILLELMTGSLVFGQKLVQNMLRRIFIIVMKLGYISKLYQREQCASKMINHPVGKQLKNVLLFFWHVTWMARTNANHFSLVNQQSRGVLKE